MGTKGKHLGGVRTLDDIKARCEEVGECWEWQKHINRYHVPQVNFNGLSRAVRKVSWEMVNGPTPKGKLITGTCGNHKCVNPDHSKPSTQAAVVRRNVEESNEPLRRSRISATQSARVGVSKEVKEAIRNDHETPALELAERLGVSESTVYKYRRLGRQYASPWAGLFRI